MSKQATMPKKKAAATEETKQEQAKPEEKAAKAAPTIYETLRAGFNRSVPLVAIETADPAATLAQVLEVMKGAAINPKTKERFDPPMVVWDCVRGCVGSNELGRDAAAKLSGGEDAITNPIELLQALPTATEHGIYVMLNAHKTLHDPRVIQGIWNLRDLFKAKRRMLVLMAPTFTMPAELQHDVLQLVEPLPDEGQLRGVIESLFNDTGMEPESGTLDAAASAALGMTAFAADNLAALAMSSKGLSIDGLWRSKRKKIDETPALRVVTGGSFAEIGGVEVAKEFLRRILKGNNAPNAIVWVDEIEKMLAGAGHDTSGVSQDQLGQMLTYMQDTEATGCVLLGPPGTVKSQICKASGTEGGIPTIQLDLGGAKGSLVGESEAKVREALKVITAISGGKTLWLATCNQIQALPPELRRRFALGTWFFDLPDEAERKSIWDIYAHKYGHTADDYAELLPRDWTGAEIKACCDIAHRMATDLKTAAGYIVPVSVAGREQIESLRTLAHGRFLSASHPGVYQRPGSEETEPRRGRILYEDAHA